MSSIGYIEYYSLLYFRGFSYTTCCGAWYCFLRWGGCSISLLMRKRRRTLLVASWLFAEYPLHRSNGAGMYSEGFRLNASTTIEIHKKALTCKYASSSPHINNHTRISISMGFPCKEINFINFSKYSFSTKAIDLLWTPRMQRKSITPSLLSCPMILHKSKIHDPDVNEFDLNALK